MTMYLYLYICSSLVFAASFVKSDKMQLNTMHKIIDEFKAKHGLKME